MVTQNSYDALYQAIEYTPKSFQRTRNVPIDTSFLLENFTELDEKIPLDIRYPGMIFFVKDAIINAGVTVGKKDNAGYESGVIDTGPTLNGSQRRLTGFLYTFENDLTKPVPLHDIVQKYLIYAVSVTPINYANLNTHLNNIFAKSGNIIYLDGLDITVICDYNGNWRYHSGTYKVTTEYWFDTIPDNLKEPNTVVKITTTGETKIVKSDLTLSDEIINANSPSDCTENGRFYNINDYFYYCFGGFVIPISDKFLVKANVKLEANSITNITHNFNSRYLSVYGIINYNSESVNNEYQNRCFPIEHIYVNLNNIGIESSVTIESIDLCIVSKTHLTS